MHTRKREREREKKRSKGEESHSAQTTTGEGAFKGKMFTTDPPEDDQIYTVGLQQQTPDPLGLKVKMNRDISFRLGVTKQTPLHQKKY